MHQPRARVYTPLEHSYTYLQAYEKKSVEIKRLRLINNVVYTARRPNAKIYICARAAFEGMEYRDRRPPIITGKLLSLARSNDAHRAGNASAREQVEEREQEAGYPSLALWFLRGPVSLISLSLARYMYIPI